jgi:uncharacterized integral membrane protein
VAVVKLYQVLWVLLKHALHGRFRDEVFVSIVLDNEVRALGLTGPIVGFSAEVRREAFCFLDAVCEDKHPWSEDPPFREPIRG